MSETEQTPEAELGANAAGEPPAPVETTALTAPAGGVPPIIDTPDALAAMVEQFGAASGPVAADAERASGFRYGQATYLAQFKRAGAGIALIDTAALPDLSSLGDALGDAEWVFHAASQDLPGMRDLGLAPQRIFDTELAARLLGWPKVGLAAVVEQELGLVLAKEHSAQDWSTRPLPADWLAYAALDVEVLLELREALAAHLERAGKSAWAQQEFEAVRLSPPAEPRVDPWRRTSGSHVLRDPRSLAVVRALWEARDAEARSRDVSPGRILRDAAIVAAAHAKPASLEALLEVPEWRSKGTKRRAPQWYPTIAAAMALDESELPDRRGPAGDGPPLPRVWKDKRPDAHERFVAARAGIAVLTDVLNVPAENLLQPDALRRACWEYREGGEAWVRSFLASRGARQWQIDLTSPVLAAAFEGVAEASAAAS